MPDPTEILQQRFRDALAVAYGEQYADVDPLIRPAQNPKFGDYQANVAMSLAKRLKASPREVAAAILEKLDLDGVCEPPEIAGPGFINLRLTADYLADQAAALQADERLGVRPAETPQQVVVDYSGPNVAKEMHVGHLRSTVIGDALVRTLAFLGHRVTRQNHLGDWGTQFGMLIEHMVDQGVRPGERYEVADLNRLYQQAKQKFDADPAFADRARQRVVLLQQGDDATLALWKQLVAESERHFEEVYRRLGVRLQPEDSRGESTYNDQLSPVADDLLQADLAKVSEGALCVFVPGYESPLMVRKADGGYGYDATDLAALRHRITELEADRLIYVTDFRQKEHFAKVFHTAEQAGWLRHAVAEHVTFGAILGEDGRPFRTRAGEVVKLIDLLDEARERAMAIVRAKNPDLDPAEQKRVAEVVGIGAIKYADLASDRTRDYVFSWDRMLAMDGNTAPYLQYAYARIRSIFRKAGLDGPPLVPASRMTIEHPAEKALILKLLQLGPTVRRVSETLMPHHLCNYLYDLATGFSAFYENCRVVDADSEPVRDSRLVLCDLTARTLQRGLELLGIEVLERM
jgi:arginyl-tRNA synthetase